MGLFDNVLKSLDSTLQAIEDGAIEKKLTEAVDALDRATNKAPEMLEKAAHMPEQAIKAAEEKAAQLQDSSEKLKTQAGKAVDIIQQD
ncbi:hypothetical protein KDA14_01900 [Candidatus Saccharibacteria bacterium]|nr:hypothetical protein [Candidatus Saccharibacteria bacterium]